MKTLLELQDDPPLFLKNNNWILYCFNNKEKAKEYLKLIKELLGRDYEDISRTEILPRINPESSWRFCLTPTQHQAIQDLLEKAIEAQHKQKDCISVLITGLQSASASINAFSSTIRLCFELPSLAKTCVVALNELGFKPDLNKIINRWTLSLSLKDWKDLRSAFRSVAQKNKPTNEFYFKTIRGDSNNFFHMFINELVYPEQKFPKRFGPKGNFTVTGEGIFSRNKEHSASYPLKTPQYTADEKSGFTKPQSASMGLVNFYPRPFGFVQRQDVLAGVILDKKDVLPTNRLFIYDGGTVSRPYEFNSEKKAKKYAEKKQTVLFSVSRMDAFKKAIFANQTKHNEPLVRLRWNCDGSSMCFIGSDNLESRLIAKQYAMTLLKKLTAASRCDVNYEIPVCFYIPDDSELNFRRYTDQEYLMDCLEAEAIYNSESLQQEKFSEKRFEFLLGLPTEKLKKILFQTRAYNLLLSILKEGNIHLFKFLQERTNLGSEVLLDMAMVNFQEQYLFIMAFTNSVRLYDTKLADYFYSKILVDKMRKPFDADLLGLNVAIRKGMTNFVKKLLSYKNIAMSGIQAALYTAANEGSTAIVRYLIEYGANVNHYYAGKGSLLFIAIAKGYDEIVRILLKARADVDKPCFGSNTPLLIAVSYGRDNIVQILLDAGADGNQSDPVLQLNPLQVASTKGYLSIVKLLVESGIYLNPQLEVENMPLYAAASNGHMEVVDFFLKRNAFIESWYAAANHAKSKGYHKIAKLIQSNISNNHLPGFSLFSPAANPGQVEPESESLAISFLKEESYSNMEIAVALFSLGFYILLKELVDKTEDKFITDGERFAKIALVSLLFIGTAATAGIIAVAVVGLKELYQEHYKV